MATDCNGSAEWTWDPGSKEWILNTGCDGEDCMPVVPPPPSNKTRSATATSDCVPIDTQALPAGVLSGSALPDAVPHKGDRVVPPAHGGKAHVKPAHH
jgi:hypothetical protein